MSDFSKIILEGVEINVKDKYARDSITKLGALIPDDFEGTDTEKVQACLDKLATTGGNIYINRVYNIEADLVNHLVTDSVYTRIVFIGVGSSAGFNMNRFKFKGDGSNISVGGLHFINITFTGTAVCFECDTLIRMMFTQCYFTYFTNVFYAKTIMQTLYFNQCYFKGLSNSAFLAKGGVWDIHITECACENSTSFFLHDINNAQTGCYNVTIRDCCIESMWGTAIKTTLARSFVIDGCYFEACVENINLTNAGSCRGVIISNNHFRESENKVIIAIPKVTQPSYTPIITIVNNTVNDYGYLIGADLTGFCYIKVEDNHCLGNSALYADGFLAGRLRDYDVKHSVSAVQTVTATANTPTQICSLAVFEGFATGKTILGIDCISMSGNISSLFHVNREPYIEGNYVKFNVDTAQTYNVQLVLIYK